MLKNKKRKEIGKLSSLLKLCLKRVYKKYGYESSIQTIENMNSPTDNEKKIMIEYINELNNKAERQMESTI